MVTEQRPHLLDLDDLARAIEQATEPARELQTKLAAAFSPFAAIHDGLQRQVDGWHGNLRRALESSGIKETLKSMDAVITRVQMLPLNLKEQLIVLAQHGWYIDPEMAVVDVQKLRLAFEEGEIEAAHAWFVDYYSDQLDVIERRLVARHPTRAKVIAAAFKAHRSGEYDLSVPPFLSQADGIALDLHQRELYIKRKDKGVHVLIDAMPEDDFNRIQWAVFQESSPLTANTKELPANFDGLNRHAVLHGVNPNYGTEANSLRALSLLNYVAYALSSE